MNRMQCEEVGDGDGGAVVGVGPADGGGAEPGGEVGGAEDPPGGAADAADAPVFADGVGAAGRLAGLDGPAGVGFATALAPGVVAAGVGTTSAGGLAGEGAGLPDDEVRAITAPPARATQAATATSGSHQRLAAGSGSGPGGGSGEYVISALGYADPGGVSGTA
jgi:hypothetical protein